MTEVMKSDAVFRHDLHRRERVESSASPATDDGAEPSASFARRTSPRIPLARTAADDAMVMRAAAGWNVAMLAAEDGALRVRFRVDDLTWPGTGLWWADARVVDLSRRGLPVVPVTVAEPLAFLLRSPCGLRSETLPTPMDPTLGSRGELTVTPLGDALRSAAEVGFPFYLRTGDGQLTDLANATFEEALHREGGTCHLEILVAGGVTVRPDLYFAVR